MTAQVKIGGLKAEKSQTAFTLNNFLPYQVVNFAERVSKSLAGIYQEEFDITVAEWRILACLGEYQVALPKDIARHTFMDKARVSRALKLLFGKQLIVKIPCEDDNRAYWVSLNKAGKRLYVSIVPKALGWEANVLAALDGAEYENLLRILQKLRERLDEVE
ncbi:MAG: MarR family winged helix-turn-helix transcriptional regulator [Pseudomonadales bacterium]